MNLPELLTLVDGFHITDKRLVRARAQLQRSGNEATERAFRQEVLRYFGSLAREAEAQMADVDRRLDDLYQRQYNLHAERAVIARRLDGARSIVRALEEV